MKIGVLGAGQLGRMIALAGIPLGHEFVFFDEEPAEAVQPFASQIVAKYSDESALADLASRVDVVTYEFENVPVAAVEFLAGKTTVRPGVAALEKAQDRLVEKQFLESLGIPVAPYHEVGGQADVNKAAEVLGLPMIVKTRRMGYDGKGQAVVRTPDDLGGVFDSLGGVPCIAEGFVNFERELSIIAVRGIDGRVVCYPLIENEHRGGILHLSVAPAPRLAQPLQVQADRHARALLEALDYVGCLTIEFFQVGKKLVANEFAPRVHNSGHWTVWGATTSQFENHVRAVAGMPLGSTRANGLCGMVNLVGELPAIEPLLEIPGAHVHWYGKTMRAGRKVGHVTFVTQDYVRLGQKLALLPDWVSGQRKAKD